MTAMERKEYLTKLVKGEILIPDVELKYDSLNGYWAEKEVMKSANHQVRINAIAELNKMDGDYAPTQVAETDSKGKDIVRAILISDSDLKL